MADWESCVEFCHKHYNNCYNCPIRGECWEKRKDKNKSRTSKEYETDCYEGNNKGKCSGSKNGTEDALIKLTESEAREKGSKGGKASAASRRRKKSMKQVMDMLHED